MYGDVFYVWCVFYVYGDVLCTVMCFMYMVCVYVYGDVLCTVMCFMYMVCVLCIW